VHAHTGTHLFLTCPSPTHPAHGHRHPQTIRPGEGIIALNQSANRDEQVFPDPDKFDIARQPNPHVAFGSGTHVCVAEWLSRVELQEALQVGGWVVMHGGGGLAAADTAELSLADLVSLL
jgi:hypothetical protein